MNTPLVIRNVAELVVVPRGPIPGPLMNHVAVIPWAAMLIEAGAIKWFGPAGDFDPPDHCRTFDAAGGCVLPGLIDAHTHLVYAGTREDEFVRRIQGRSYAQIAEEGGGIRVTMEAVRRTSLDDLVELALPRLARMLANGVTTAEVKSGYGLNVEDETKMLRAVRLLDARQPIDLVGTYLAAHTTPPEFAGRPDEYLDALLADDVLARIRDERLAEFCDVFCEQTAFDVQQSRRVLEAGRRFSLRPKLHADQISQMGATRLAGEVRAISADHLEQIDDGGIEALRAADTIAVLLPGCSFFLNVPQAPARRIMAAGVPVAIATDYNPGSAMIESLPLVMHIACTRMRLTPTEAIVAATANAAAALGRQDRLGSITVGAQADLVVLDVPNHRRWLYEPGRNCVRAVIKGGSVVHRRNQEETAPSPVFRAPP
jgi:imidazolonepropionase